MGEVITLQNDAPAVQPKPLLTPAAHAALLSALGMPDVTGLSVPQEPSVGDLAGIVLDLEERAAHAKAVYDEVMREPLEMIAVARAQIKRQIEATGGSKMTGRDFIGQDYTVRLESKTHAGKPSKDMLRLLQLRGKITQAEFDATFSRTLIIKSNLDEGTVGKIKALVPAADVAITDHWDAHGAKLNALAGSNSYGPHSEVGQIIASGYVSTRVQGAPQLVIERRPQLKAVAGEVIAQ